MALPKPHGSTLMCAIFAIVIGLVVYHICLGRKR